MRGPCRWSRTWIAVRKPRGHAKKHSRGYGPMKITRRSAIGILASTAALEQAAAQQAAAQPTEAPGTTDVHWLEGAPGMEIGVTWGVPWARGAVQRGQAFTLAPSTPL